MISFLKKGYDDEQIVAGLQAGGTKRPVYEKALYSEFFYFINQGVKKYGIGEESAASAYSDTIIIVIDSLISGKFEGRASLKSYAFQIFCNKCVDLIRKNTTNRSAVHNAVDVESLVTFLPDKACDVVQALVDKNTKSVLLQKLNEIGEKCKSILLFFEDGYSDKEIAEMLKYNSADVVKTSRLRCIEKLKQKFIGSRQQ
jgi:RNA polymerase sigma factor (sigma-70 family)